MHGVGRALAHIGKDGVHNACIVLARHESGWPTHLTQAFMLVWARGLTTDMKHDFSSIVLDSRYKGGADRVLEWQCGADAPWSRIDSAFGVVWYLTTLSPTPRFARCCCRLDRNHSSRYLRFLFDPYEYSICYKISHVSDRQYRQS